MNNKKPLSKLVFVTALSLFVYCAAPIKQFYPDTYYPEDHIYENKPLRFLLTYKGNWYLFTDPNEMDRNTRAYSVSLQKTGVELLFVGTTTDGLHGTRGIAVDLNEPSRDYAEYIRRINEKDVQNDKGLIDFIAGKNSMMKWVYDKDGFRFEEFFFNIDTYDIRIAFWTKPELFERFVPVYEEIMSTLTVTSGM